MSNSLEYQKACNSIVKYNSTHVSQNCCFPSHGIVGPTGPTGPQGIQGLPGATARLVNSSNK